ncbi:MAG: polysaccharide deacetylase family protein, partial [Bacillota bacterium]|nr:polysaccharide deacetylase family protein [Bacillota bacterium]
GKATTGKIAYLTFDDGPLAATAQILNVLKEHDVKATFFVNGRDSDYALHMYKRMVAEGHAVGNHTYSHEYDKVYSSVSGFIAEVEQLQMLVYETTGIAPEILRFPAGSDNRVSFRYSGRDLMPTLTRVVRAMGMQYFDWNVTSGSANAAATAESVYTSVIDGCQGKSVVNILFHESRVVALALPSIIEELKLQGYSFAALTTTSPAMQFLRVRILLLLEHMGRINGLFAFIERKIQFRAVTAQSGGIWSDLTDLLTFSYLLPCLYRNLRDVCVNRLPATTVINGNLTSPLRVLFHNA